MLVNCALNWHFSEVEAQRVPVPYSAQIVSSVYQSWDPPSDLLGLSDNVRPDAWMMG